MPRLLRKCARSIAEFAPGWPPRRCGSWRRQRVNRMLNRLGKKSEFVDGLRVTDAETRDTALMVLAGRSTRSWWLRFDPQGCRRLDSAAAMV